MPTNLQQQLEQSIGTLKIDTDLLHKVLHGPESGPESVNTVESGELKSFMRLQKEIVDALESTSIIADVTALRDETKDARDEAVAAAGAMAIPDLGDIGKFYAAASDGSGGVVADFISLPAATDVAPGIVALATAAEIAAGIVANKAATPAAIKLSGIADMKARENIAILSFKVLQLQGISIQKYIDGYSDDFADLTGVDTSNPSWGLHDATGKFVSNKTLVQISNVGTTNIGNMTSGGGLAAAFDGTLNQAASGSTWRSGAPGYIGKDFGIGVSKDVKEVRITSTNDRGFDHNSSFGSTTNVTLTNQVSNDNYNNSVDRGNVVLPTNLAVIGQTIKIPIVGVGGYRYWRVKVEGTGMTYPACAELQYFENSPLTELILISQAQVALVQPSRIGLVISHEAIDPVIFNTDIIVYVSRDNGGTWTQASLSVAGDLDATRKILIAEADVSGTPAGVIPKYRITTHNGKEQRVHAVSCHWR